VAKDWNDITGALQELFADAVGRKDTRAAIEITEIITAIDDKRAEAFKSRCHCAEICHIL
jgi:hypothetical protein